MTLVDGEPVEPLEVVLVQQIASAQLDWPALTQALSSTARARLKDMRAAGRRNEFILGRTLATQLLLATIGNDSWDLMPRTGGKPVAIGSTGREHAALSVSHSRGHVLCAIAPTGQLGCDIEVPRLRSAASWRRLANFDLPHPVFASHERHWILAADEVAQQTRLFALWTIKEAIGKASGAGLRRGLAELLVDVATIPVDLLRNVDHDNDAPAHGQSLAQGRTHDASHGLHWHWQLRHVGDALISVAADRRFAARWLATA